MNNFTITSTITKIIWTEAETEQITLFVKNISSDNIKENSFFEYCKKWKVAPWVFIQLSRHDLIKNLSEKIQTLFKESHLKVKTENEKRNKEAIRFLSEFKKNNIDVVILKGNLLAHTIYKDVGYKRMNDFDILIHNKDWDKIQDIYFSLGYIPLGFGWSGEKEKPAKFSHVGMSFISPDFSCIIGSQWGIKSPTTYYNVNITEVWQTAIEFDFMGVKTKQLTPEYNLLHLILHMGIFKCGIRDCMDVYNLVLSGNIDLKIFTKIIEDSNAINKAYFTLFLSNMCSHTLDKFLSAIKPNTGSFITRRLNKRIAIYKVTNDFQESYNDYFQDIEKLVIYFNLFPTFHKKLIFYFLIIKNVFCPKTEIALKLSDCSPHKSTWNILKAKLVAPYFVFSLIAQEIGWKFTFLLFLKLFFDLILSLKNYIIKKESYFDYLKKRSIDPKSIENVVKNIQ